MTPNESNDANLLGAPPEAGATRVGDQVTTDDTRLQLATTLADLRRARPGFQEELRSRLVARLPEVREPWWRRARAPVPTNSREDLRRRAMLGVAAAGALSLFVINLAIPLGGRAPEASAREILAKVHAASENPIRAGVTSFHLTATTTGARRDGPGGTVTAEQWFVAPDKMRTEARTTLADGSTAVSGFVQDGANVQYYASANAKESPVVGVFVAPVRAPLPGAKRPDGSTPGLEGTDDGLPLLGMPISKPVNRPGAAGGRYGTPEAGEAFLMAAEGEGGTGDRHVEVHAAITATSCPEPRGKGGAMVAGRPVFVVEADMSRCAPEGAPDELRGRHVRWVDQETFLPLKTAMYDKSGKLIARYEVTSIAYDASIDDSTLSRVPTGTIVQEPKLPPPTPPDGVRPGVLPATEPSGR